MHGATVKISKALHLVHSCVWYCSWVLRKVDQKRVESFVMYFERMVDEISWTDRVRNEEKLY